MPLLPPAMPHVQHPADLVVDLFGTFLGKRSERLLVRWKHVDDGMTPLEPAPPAEPATDSPGNTSTNTSSTSADAVPEPVAESQPQTSQEIGEAQKPVQPVVESLARTPAPHPADLAAAQLIKLWGSDSAAERPILPKSRMEQQLAEFASLPLMARPNDWCEQEVPLSRLRSITISGRGVTVSSDLVSALVERGIGVSFLSGRGQPLAQLVAPALSGTVQTRRSQLAAYTTPLGVQLAVEFIRGKLRNQKHQLQYSGKYLKTTAPERFERLAKKIASISNIRKQLSKFTGDSLEQVRDKLMGYEGTGARVYWEGVSILLQERVPFPGRKTRGAIDPVNAALNYGYGILYGQVSAAVVNAGLELFAGFLHVDRPGKPALVLDLVEEFRAPIVDRVVLAMANQNITFETNEHGLTAASRKQLAQRILERLETTVPYEGKRWPLGRVIQSQARHLAVAVRGERTYRAFASRW